MVQDESTTDELLARLRDAQRVLADAIEPVLRERPTMEHVLLSLFLVAGTYMYWGALEFSPAAAEFPRIMAGATALLSFLILVRNYLHAVVPVLAAVLGGYAVYTGALAFLADDGGLARILVGVGLLVATGAFRTQLVDGAESFIAEPMQVLGEDDLIGDDDDETAADDESVDSDAEGDSGAMYVYEIDDPKGPVVTGLLCTGYMVLTFAIGMLYATPVFVAAWALWVGMDAAKGAALTGLGLVCSYLFYDVIQSDISEGWLTGWEPTPPDDLYAWYVDPLLQPLFRVIDRYVIYPLLRLLTDATPLGVSLL
ncbi:hypothetical protein [Halorubrum sp. JWXQ-INN 858]|uniref:hypothetical protein n=1 Tax=Halorubrum sp. JWXQ-INN 858 TaxID=2690782 RepID=UPI00190FAA11|nr:hypothetical protein [Halorubrum sp. JWXQ-INN 858]